MAAKNKYYTAFIPPPQRNTQGSSLYVKWVLVYIKTYFILQNKTLFNLMYNKSL